jgi:hypothetical protein
MSEASDRQPPQSMHLLLTESALRASVTQILSDPLIEVLKHSPDSTPFAINRITEIVTSHMLDIKTKFQSTYEDRLKALQTTLLTTSTQLSNQKKKKNHHKQSSLLKAKTILSLESNLQDLNTTIAENLNQ